MDVANRVDDHREDISRVEHVEYYLTMEYVKKIEKSIWADHLLSIEH
jgi:hypothetical protein